MIYYTIRTTYLQPDGLFLSAAFVRVVSKDWNQNKSEDKQERKTRKFYTINDRRQTPPCNHFQILVLTN